MIHFSAVSRSGTAASEQILLAEQRLLAVLALILVHSVPILSVHVSLKGVVGIICILQQDPLIL